MISVLLFGFLASTLAAPQFGQYRQRFGPPPFFPDYHHMRAPPQHEHGYMENIFDTNQLWRDMSKEMKEIELMVADLNRHFSAIRTAEDGIVGNEYKITIPLSGYDEKDIVVKAREGIIMIQASHQSPGGSQSNYLEIRSLPDSVLVNGTWVYEKSTLTITFPLKEGVTTPSPTQAVNVVTAEFTTKAPNFDREEIDENKGDGGEENADVGLNRGDLGKNTEILTNEVPDTDTVEATTYAVDLKDEVEFVPIRY